jgi:hypothetical protein
MKTTRFYQTTSEDRKLEICKEYFDDNGGEVDGNSYLCEEDELLGDERYYDLDFQLGYRAEYRGSDEEKEYYDYNASYWTGWSGGRNEVFMIGCKPFGMK